MSYVNTVDIMGEQATLDALVSGTLTEFIDDRIKVVLSCPFKYNTNIRKIILPNLHSISNGSFMNCTALEILDLGSVASGFNAQNAFTGCLNLRAIVIRNPNYNMNFIPNAALDKSQIYGFCGAIYVDDNLVSQYKNRYLDDANGYMMKYVIRPISEYSESEIPDLSTIPLTWTQIKAAIDDESFFNGDYTIGDIKKIEYGTQSERHIVYAEIRYIDTTNKFVDFVLLNSCEVLQKINNTQAFLHYSDTNIKLRLDEIYANELPQDLKSIITPVTKYYHYKEPNSNATQDEITAHLWALNFADIGHRAGISELTEPDTENYYSTQSYKMSKINTYLSPVNSSNSRTNTKCVWHLGSTDTHDNGTMACVGSNGGIVYNSSNTTAGLIFGFRIQKTT